MGHFALFNTNFQYPLQIHEIFDLCGVQEKNTHTWYKHDQECVLINVRQMEVLLSIKKPVRFERYLQHTIGTRALYRDLYATIDPTNEYQLFYMFAVLVYHQLLYKTPLVLIHQ